MHKENAVLLFLFKRTVCMHATKASSNINRKPERQAAVSWCCFSSLTDHSWLHSEWSVKQKSCPLPTGFTFLSILNSVQQHSPDKYHYSNVIRLKLQHRLGYKPVSQLSSTVRIQIHVSETHKSFAGKNKKKKKCLKGWSWQYISRSTNDQIKRGI